MVLLVVGTGGTKKKKGTRCDKKNQTSPGEKETSITMGERRIKTRLYKGTTNE